MKKALISIAQVYEKNKYTLYVAAVLLVIVTVGVIYHKENKSKPSDGNKSDGSGFFSDNIAALFVEEDVNSISVYFSNYWLKSPQLKEITDQGGIELIKGLLEQIQYDTSIEDDELYAGGDCIHILLRHTDGSERSIPIFSRGNGEILIQPNNGERYRGTWSSADEFWDLLDYPIIEIAQVEWPSA